MSVNRHVEQAAQLLRAGVDKRVGFASCLGDTIETGTRRFLFQHPHSSETLSQAKCCLVRLGTSITFKIDGSKQLVVRELTESFDDGLCEHVFFPVTCRELSVEVLPSTKMVICD